MLDGYDGTVQVEVPEFYLWSETEGTKSRVYVSTQKVVPYAIRIPHMLVDAYRSTVLNEVPEDMGYLSTLQVNSAISVVNTSSYCRGGNNSSSSDTYLESDKFRTNLGKPRTNTSRANFRTYAKNAGKMLLTYEYYKAIFYWLYVIEYANFNSQASYVEDLTEDGYRQGGLGSGVTTWSDSLWYAYNENYPITPCGYCNEFGNFTGIKDLVIPASDDINTITFKVPRWRGFDNVFGDIWTNLDGELSTKSLAKMSESLKRGYSEFPERREKIRNKALGRKMPKDTRCKISLNHSKSNLLKINDEVGSIRYWALKIGKAHSVLSYRLKVHGIDNLRKYIEQRIKLV